jgi:hypothetical protein
MIAVERLKIARREDGSLWVLGNYAYGKVHQRNCLVLREGHVIHTVYKI